LGLVVDEVAESLHESLMGELNNAHDGMVEVRVHASWLVVPSSLSDVPDSLSDAAEGLELILYQGTPLPLESRCVGSGEG
jgi:hypothetical protein